MLPVDEEVDLTPLARSTGNSPPATPAYTTPSPTTTTRSQVATARSVSPSPRARLAASPRPPNTRHGGPTWATSYEAGTPMGVGGGQVGSVDASMMEEGFNPQEDRMVRMHVVRATLSQLSQCTAQSRNCRHMPTTGSNYVSKNPSQASSIMMDVMRLMTKTNTMSSSGSNLSLTPATIVREAQRGTKAGHSRDRRCSLSGTAVIAVLFALLAALCLGVVWYLFEEHNGMLCDAAIEVFRRSARSACSEGAEERLLEQGEDDLRAEMKRLGERTRIKIILTLLGIFVCAATSLLGCGIVASRKLRLLSNLSKLLEKLGTLDFSTDSEEFAVFCHGRRSSVREIAQLQDTFFNLFKGIALFSRFVPETVVQRIVDGDTRATRLYVDRRWVTIMFSDIQDFTRVSEQLAQFNPRQLLFLLTRYFSIMTHIVEKYEGTVGEILGDGLLVFWNTPKNVRNHASKACAAALAQQRALQYLNPHFSSLGLPAINIRIGVNTGKVLSGNIGSFTKMKFGCMGDPVNLASRLEGLCKVYGAGIVCSRSTYEALAPNHGFLCRRLDTVKVKGRQTPTDIYEVVARDESSILPAAGIRQSDDAQAAWTGCTGANRGSTIPGERSAPVDWRGNNQIPRIQDVVTEVTGGLHALYSGVRPESIWEELCEEDPAFPSIPVNPLSDSEREDHVMSVSIEQQRHAAKYEDALRALQQDNPVMAYELASELLNETPDDVATQRLRDKANDHCIKSEIVLPRIPGSPGVGMSCCRSRGLGCGGDSDMAVTQMLTKGSN